MSLVVEQYIHLGFVQKISGIFAGNCYHVSKYKTGNKMFIRFKKIKYMDNLTKVTGFGTYLYKKYPEYVFDDFKNDGDGTIIYEGIKR